MAHNLEVTADDTETNGVGVAPQPPPPSLKHRNSNQHRTLPVATVDVHKGESIRLQVKVRIPTEDHPNYNFVGKLLGPKGNSLKWLQEHTQTKMAILGRGSMKNKEKEEQLRRENDPKFSHLNENLHVEITATAPAPEAYRRIGTALAEVKRFLVPDYYDDIRQQQLRELGVISGPVVEESGSSPTTEAKTGSHSYGVSLLNLQDDHHTTDNNNNCHDLRKPVLASSKSSLSAVAARSHHHHLVINRNKPYHSSSSSSPFSYKSPTISASYHRL